jgi:hypothetical protein
LAGGAQGEGQAAGTPFIMQTAISDQRLQTTSQIRWARVEGFVKQMKQTFGAIKPNSTINHVRSTFRVMHRLEQLAKDGFMPQFDTRSVAYFFAFSTVFLVLFAKVNRKSRKWLRLWSTWLIAGILFTIATGSLGLILLKILRARG